MFALILYQINEPLKYNFYINNYIMIYLQMRCQKKCEFIIIII